MLTDAQCQNSILRITDDKTLKLIELYRQEQCLWNTNIPAYKSREKRARATERIACRLDVKNFEARHVVIKFKNLRNSYCQELKKIAASASLGLSDEESYKPKVFWFTKMDSFLRPHLQPGRCVFQNLQMPEIEPPSKSEEEEDSDSNHASEDYRVSESNLASEDSRHSYHVTADDIPPDYCIPPPAKRRALNHSRCQEDLLEHPRRQDELAQTVRDLETKVQALTEVRQEDYYDHFGKYIASLLRSVPKERAMLLQPRIISLIVKGGGESDVDG